MPSYRQCSRIDTLELQSQIIKKLGRLKADKYFSCIKKLLSSKLGRSEFARLLCSTIGIENIDLHNTFVRAILGNAGVPQGSPANQASTGHSRNGRTPGGYLGDLLPSSPKKGRSVTSRDRRPGDRRSPLGPYGKGVPAGNAEEVTTSCDPPKSRAPEVMSIGSKAFLEVVSVEDGEEVEQAWSSPGVQSRSPLRPPLGIPICGGGLPRRALGGGSSGLCLSRTDAPQTCQSTSELPDTRSLMKRLERRLELEGLGLPVDCADLLNNGLDVYMKRLIKPCVELAKSRCCDQRTAGRSNGNVYYGRNGLCYDGQVQRPSKSYSASVVDFQVAMQLNPRLLGLDWPARLEKICLHASEE